MYNVYIYICFVPIFYNNPHLSIPFSLQSIIVSNSDPFG